MFKFLECPVPNCPHHATGHRGGLPTRSSLINHIASSHQHQLHLADQQYCQLANIHICHLCPAAVFSSAKKLAQHNRKHHPNSRTSTNLSICTSQLQGTIPPNYAPSWKEALQFINLNFAPNPASFRSGLQEKISPALKTQFDDIFLNIIKAYVEAANTYIGEEEPEWNSKAHVFLWLLFHVEMLVLGPQKDKKSESINQCVGRRINLFRCGHIEQLWQESRQVQSRMPGYEPPLNRDDIDKSIQDAADKDNKRTAYARAVRPATIANITPKLRPHVVNKYPPRRNLTYGYGRAATFIAHNQQVLKGDIIESIRKQHRGKANGLFMDSLDVFIRLVKRDDTTANKAIRTLFQRIYKGEIDDCVHPYFSNTYLFCLHKDESDPTKLRPIGIPTAIRRIITNHVARTYRRRFAHHLLPHNFAIGIDGGMDFVIKSAQLAVERYITAPLEAGMPPTRVFISLDLQNMFNELSRDLIFKIIEDRYPELLPLVSMLYDKPGTVFYKMADGQWYTQSMEEGVNQGCPLSSTLAALVLHEVLEPLTAKLNARAEARRANGDFGDDGYGGQTHAQAYIDDCGAAVPLQDVSFFLDS